jgi:hypothetical protein
MLRAEKGGKQIHNVLKAISFQSWKNTKSLHNLNSLFVSCTSLSLAFTKEIAGIMKKFTQNWKNVHKYGFQVMHFGWLLFNVWKI